MICSIISPLGYLARQKVSALLSWVIICPFGLARQEVSALFCWLIIRHTYKKATFIKDEILKDI